MSIEDGDVGELARMVKLEVDLEHAQATARHNANAVKLLEEDLRQSREQTAAALVRVAHLEQSGEYWKRTAESAEREVSKLREALREIVKNWNLGDDAKVIAIAVDALTIPPSARAVVSPAATTGKAAEVHEPDCALAGNPMQYCVDCGVARANRRQTAPIEAPGKGEG
jgi:hypothetical protein